MRRQCVRPERNVAAIAIVNTCTEKQEHGVHTCLTTRQDQNYRIALDLGHGHTPLVVVLQDIAHEVYLLCFASLDSGFYLFRREHVFFLCSIRVTFGYHPLQEGLHRLGESIRDLDQRAVLDGCKQDPDPRMYGVVLEASERLAEG